MTHRLELSHEFVEVIPSLDQMTEGKLYISIAFATASHLCMDGCGEEVVTPLSPQQWKLQFDGRTVSLTPSIGNWSFACQSHYWIQNDRIRWDKQFSREAIARTRSGRAESIRAASKTGRNLERDAKQPSMLYRILKRLRS